MSETTTDSVQSPEVGDQGEKNTKDTVQYDTYQRVLSEKKKRDQEVKDLRTKLNEFETNSLEAKGELQKLNDQLKKQVSELNMEKDRLSKSFAWNSVQSQIKAVAAQSGCVDMEALVKLGDWSTVEVDQDFKVDESQVKMAIETSQKKYPYLFKKQVPGVKDKSPSNSDPSSHLSKKDLTKLSAEQLKAAYAKARTKEGYKDG